MSKIIKGQLDWRIGSTVDVSKVRRGTLASSRRFVHYLFLFGFFSLPRATTKRWNILVAVLEAPLTAAAGAEAAAEAASSDTLWRHLASSCRLPQLSPWPHSFKKSLFEKYYYLMLHGFTLIWVRNFRLNDYQSEIETILGKCEKMWRNDVTVPQCSGPIVFFCCWILSLVFIAIEKNVISSLRIF